MKENNEKLLNDFREALEAFVPQHSGACAQSPEGSIREGIFWYHRDGEMVITRESCKCNEEVKRARDLLGGWMEPVDPENLKPNEGVHGFNM